MNQTFVFIVGCPRSGTTFLRKATAAISGVLDIAGETAFFRNFWGRYGDLRNPANLCAMMRDFIRTRAFSVSQVQPDAFAQALAAEPEMDYGRFFIIFSNLSSLARNGVRPSVIVEKTPTHTFCIDRIQRTFPNAKFIGLIRNPYAVASSHVERRPKRLRLLFQFRRWIIVVAILDWLRHYDEIMSRSRALGSQRFFVLNYERLVRDYTTTMEDLAKFMGSSVDLATNGVDPTDSSIDKYRHKLSEKELALISDILCENDATSFCEYGKVRRGSVPLTDKALVYPLYKLQTGMAAQMGANSKIYLLKKLRRSTARQ